MTEKESNNLYEKISHINNWNDTRLGIFSYNISSTAWYEIQVIYADFTDAESHPRCKLYFVGFGYNKKDRIESFERTFLYKGLLNDCMKAAYKDCSENIHVNGLQ